MRKSTNRSSLRAARALIVPAVVLALVTAVGCKDILRVDLPGRIPTKLLDDPTAAPTLAGSVVADFECAYSNYVTSTATLSDEFLGASGNLSAEQWGTRKIIDTDVTNEQAQCGAGYGAYTPLQVARFQADSILTRLEGWTDDESHVPLAPLRARVATYGAYTYTLLGEGFCAMRLDGEHVIHTPQEVLAIADEKFTHALELIAAMDDGDAKSELLNLASVGRARTRLDLGNTSGAESDAALVTPGFEFFVTRSVDAQTRLNTAWQQMVSIGNTSVAPEYRHLTVGGVPDPRVQVSAGQDVGQSPKAFDGTTDLYVLTNKNFSGGDPMRLASYVEAQLIRAEALGGSQAVSIINARRAQLSLPAYTGPTDAASVTALILDERNREFFMEGGQRYNDLLRYHIPWKVGNDQNGTPYGSTTCMPLPQSERLAAGG